LGSAAQSRARTPAVVHACASASTHCRSNCAIFTPRVLVSSCRLPNRSFMAAQPAPHTIASRAFTSFSPLAVAATRHHGDNLIAAMSAKLPLSWRIACSNRFHPDSDRCAGIDHAMPTIGLVAPTPTWGRDGSIRSNPGQVRMCEARVRRYPYGHSDMMPCERGRARALPQTEGVSRGRTHKLATRMSGLCPSCSRTARAIITRSPETADAAAKLSAHAASGRPSPHRPDARLPRGRALVQARRMRRFSCRRGARSLSVSSPG